MGLLSLNRTNKSKPQKRFNITFRENQQEEELYNWIKSKGQVGGISNFIKTEMYKLMLQEQEQEKNKKKSINTYKL